MATRAQMLSALDRRLVRWNTRVRWLGDRVRRNIHIGMERRLVMTAQLLRDRIVINLSIPVVKIVTRTTRTDPATGRVTRSSKTRVDPDSRSRPGEFPRADTTRLMKDIFYVVDQLALRASVGTSLDYGAALELRMNRSFIRRTLFETQSDLAIVLVTNRGGTLPGQDA